MQPLLIAILAIAVLALEEVSLSPAQADDRVGMASLFRQIDAEEMIDHCWDISLALRSGSTASARRGFVESVACLRKTIVEQALPMFEPGVLTPAYAEWLLIRMADPYAEFFDNLYNSHKHCFCGTMMTSIDLWAVSRLYEQVLRDVVAQRNAYGL
jgi:hypothetical protein